MKAGRWCKQLLNFVFKFCTCHVTPTINHYLNDSSTTMFAHKFFIFFILFMKPHDFVMLHTVQIQPHLIFSGISFELLERIAVLLLNNRKESSRYVHAKPTGSLTRLLLLQRYIVYHLLFCFSVLRRNQVDWEVDGPNDNPNISK